MRQITPSPPPRLNEIDYLMVVKDRSFRREAGRGNACFLSLTLESSLSAAALTKLVEGQDAWRSLRRLRLSYRLFGYPRWVVSDSQALPSHLIEEHALPLDAVSEFVALRDINPELEPPLQLCLLQHGTRSTILFGWHHALLDAHRAEALLLALLCEPEPSQKKLGRRPPAPLSFGNSLRSAEKARKFILKTSKPPLCTLPLPLSTIPLPLRGTRAAPQYTFIRFTEDETLQVSQSIRDHGLELFPSCFLIAATARAFQQVAIEKGQAPAALLVPVPHDSRRGHSIERQASNELSIFFFRIEHAALSNLRTAAASLLQQAEYFVKEDLHRGVPLFLGFNRILPPWPYLKLLGSASGGAFASFYFSDIGDSLSKFQSISEKTLEVGASGKILDAVHFPPLFYPPGICFVASRRNGCLMLTIVSSPDVVSESDLGGLVGGIRRELSSPVTQEYP